jgi:hypothetical protein
MPGLSRGSSNIGYRLKPVLDHINRGAQNFKPKIVRRVKEKVDQLLQARFMQPCRYADWVFNIVPVEKKNTRKIQICVDFRNLN